MEKHVRDDLYHRNSPLLPLFVGKLPVFIGVLLVIVEVVLGTYSLVPN